MKQLQLLFACLLAFGCVNLLSAQCTVNGGNDVTLYQGYAPLECATLTAAATGTPPFTFVWSTGDTAQSISVCDSAATYIVTVTDSSGCTASDTVQVSVINVSCHPNGHKVSVCHVPPGNPANAHTICVGAPAVPAHLAHGDYLGPCTAPPPAPDSCSADLGADTVLCPGTTVTLDADSGFASYLWSDSSTAQTLTVSVTDTYWVAVTDSAGCTASDTIIVTVDSSALQVDAGADVTLGCSDSCATLSASATNGTAPYTYLWSSSDTTADIIVCDSTTATYTVTIVDTMGCAGSDTVVFIVGNTLTADAGANVTRGCNDSCTTLTATVAGGTPPYVYAWSTGDSTASISVCDTVATTYYLTVTDSTGCIASDSVTVFPVGCAQGKVLICHVPPGNPMREHNICVSANAVNAHLNHGDYLGCCNNAVIQRVARGPRLLVWPSPAIQKVSLEYELADEGYISISLFTISGKKVSEVFAGPSGISGMVEVELAQFPQGMYVAEIKTADGLVSHEKFMLLK